LFSKRFDQSIDHPDLRRFQQLIETISLCANDCEERNYTLGRDANTLFDSIRQLRELLVRKKILLINQTKDLSDLNSPMSLAGNWNFRFNKGLVIFHQSRSSWNVYSFSRLRQPS